MNDSIIFEKPADNWNEAFPIGNGRLGAMVFGRVSNELLQMNEDSVWLGGYKDRNNRAALHYLPELRKRIFEGKIKKAEKLLKRAFSGIPQSMQPYQPLGNINLSFENGFDNSEITEYERYLNLDTAVVTIKFSMGGCHHKGCIGKGVTMDNMILRDLFSECIKASEILDCSDPVIENIKVSLSKLRPISIGKYGQIMEWERTR